MFSGNESASYHADNEPLVISLTLANRSASSIPLAIPGVMNPNLSPMSNSGVNLELGQKVYFYSKKGRRGKELLFITTEDLAGQTLIVNKLIKERKKELEAEKK
jgi:hypothetical protein